MRPFSCWRRARRPLLAISAAASVASAPVQAQQSTDEPVDRFGDVVMAGIGVGLVPDYEGSDDTQVVPVPGAVGRVGGYKFIFLGNRFTMDLLRDTPGPGWDLQLGPVVGIGFDRASVKGIKDPRIQALGKVGTAIELGVQLGIARQGLLVGDIDRLSVGVGVRKDVAGAHGGLLVNPRINYMTPLSRKLLVVVLASASHADQNFADSLFTITPAQSAASGLPAYSAKAGWKDWTLGAAVSFSLSDDLTHGLTLNAGITYSRLLGSFAESPVVSVAGSRNQTMMALGLGYTF